MTNIGTMDHCGICESDKNLTESYCCECEMAFCEGCFFVHNRIPVCKNHRVNICSEFTSRDDVNLDGARDVNCPKARFSCDTTMVKLKILNSFSSKINTDDAHPEIRSLMLTDCGIILATDWQNCTLKAFDIKGKLLGKYIFEPLDSANAGRIHGITMIDNETVYVTLPSFYKIASLKIVRLRDNIDFSAISFKTNRRYFGIAALKPNKQLMVGTTGAVDILSHQGKYLYTVKSQSFQSPFNMTSLDSGDVFLTDTKANSILKISGKSLNVESLTINGSFLKLRGITSDGRGNVFFCTTVSRGVDWIKTRSSLEHVGTIFYPESGQFGVGIYTNNVEGEQLLAVAESNGTISVLKVSYL